MAARDCNGAGWLQGQDRQPALLSRELEEVAAEERAEVGQTDAGWQGCASLVEWRRVGVGTRTWGA